MTIRITQPDTQADVDLRECLDADKPISFVMVAGAGSGKTTSLIKALDHVGKKYGAELNRRKQKVVCITYTEIAQQEIWNDVGQNLLFHVSTIHSFLWTVIRPFQSDIKKWVFERINEKITEAQERIEKPRTRPATIEKLKEEIAEYGEILDSLASVSRFTYGTGSSYDKGILGHDDIIKMVPVLIVSRPLLRSIIIDKYPYIFIDESQDTTEVVVEAMKAIESQGRGKFCLGFFGDPMQKIYSNGIGDIPMEKGWIRIEKPENFRCPASVLSVINNIRAGGDALVQVSGKAGIDGTARMFIIPADEHRSERLHGVKKWLAESNNDQLWISDDKDADVKVLVTLHRVAASRLGFAELYAAFNDNDAPSSLKTGFIDGGSWALTPILSYILPLYELAKKKKEFEIVTFLRKNSPLLSEESLKKIKVSKILTELSNAVTKLVELIDSVDHTIIEVLLHARESQIFLFEDRLNDYLNAYESGVLASKEGLSDEMFGSSDAMMAFFKCPASQLIAYKVYIINESPFATQQGIKGAEFARVLAVLDDEEGQHIMFSYNKFFGIAPLSPTDRDNLTNGKETVLDRTRRLFYVICSRATKDLAVVLYAVDPDSVYRQIISEGIFPEKDVFVLK
ncbi:MAG: ATP-dependent helicase [Deltaproteobacteria bacterium]|nr:ATP-dependent helicase [Deltaproteobacteria bacterium]